MSVKLFTIGDSISQGFISGAAAEPSIAYSTLIANAMSIANYNAIIWPNGYKLKYDLEGILRALESVYGNNLSPKDFLTHLPGTFLKTINDVLDKSEKYFESGLGQIGHPIPGAPQKYHNIAVEGMDIADAWLVTPRLANTIVSGNGNSKSNNYFQGASSPFYRNAYRTLNPTSNALHMDKSALSWLNFISDSEGIENIALWLGSNNVLGTIFDLDLSWTDGSGSILNQSRVDRQKYNIWDTRDFRREYEILLDKLILSLSRNQSSHCEIFVGNIPLITITPALKGFGKEIPVSSNGSDSLYFEYYTLYPIDESIAIKGKRYLTFTQARKIDDTIIEYNEIIKELIQKKGTSKISFHLVDLSSCLTSMAYKRNFKNPPYKFPDYFKENNITVNTLFYDVDKNGQVEKGGLFGLDGVHPSAIGQGLIAHEFLKVMRSNGLIANDLNWDNIIKSDTLYSNPIKIIHSLHSIKNKKLVKLFLSALLKIKDVT
ncbi:hypothetical protein [Photobacterium galatheae]|uniref:Uncharacterized protein n=1 Tax=Photobacterium galatheae TaxID=1654360 RepID=A0A066S069_9GAMM|nr:hypothetical protein [Photobacterium galatheae]KDM93332.1 hypothetical protein EA58_01605 [Photobacterium galatheae]MCM0150454.1 hypothetical protein [Photobacterium galatheae]